MASQVVCPHCGNLAPLTETRQLKKHSKLCSTTGGIIGLQILGIAKGSSRQQIQSAYRRRTQMMHPDKPQGDRAAFEKLTEAHDRLLQVYDSQISHNHRERAQVVLRVMTDVKKDSWQEWLRRGTVQPICDDQMEKLQRVHVAGRRFCPLLDLTRRFENDVCRALTWHSVLEVQGPLSAFK
eukprot:symbB.v1.2.031905.t1/scaffold3755.1/size50881/2